MPNILIVESDSPEVATRRKATNGATEAESYASVLGRIRADATFSLCAPYEGDTPPLDGIDAVVFTGSGVEWNTDDDRAEPLRAYMRRVFKAGLPTFGSCNGMQLAASVLGGSTGASPNGREDGVALDVRLTEAGKTHPMMAGKADTYAMPCVHRDEVQALPKGATLLASNAHSSVQAFAYERDGVAFWGCQYHPEYTLASLAGYLGKEERVTPQVAADLALADDDDAAAVRLGAQPGAFAFATRTLELRNWLNQI